MEDFWMSSDHHTAVTVEAGAEDDTGNRTIPETFKRIQYCIWKLSVVLFVCFCSSALEIFRQFVFASFSWIHGYSDASSTRTFVLPVDSLR